MSIAIDPSADVTKESHDALHWINKTRPAGVTPLTSHILEIQREVADLSPRFRASGQRVALCICTDGLPSDDQGYGGEQHNQAFVNSLRSMEGLPMWIIIRLCTDDDAVVNFCKFFFLSSNCKRV
jgi:Mg-chelatase subunit ChlD